MNLPPASRPASEPTSPSATDAASTAIPPHLPRVLILATGGTIAGAAGSAAQSLQYQAGALTLDVLLAAVPGLDRLAVIEAQQFAAIDSKDASLDFLCSLSREVMTALARDDVDGIVITHGTDTLEETAYWLHLTVGSDKPVVMTAAMRPATALSADGPANLFDAVTLAAAPAARGQGVLVAFANRIHSARDVVKASSHAVNAFASPEQGALGWVQDGRVAFTRTMQGAHAALHTSASRFARVAGWRVAELAGVDIVVSYAGVSPRQIDALLDGAAGAVAGVVVAGTGNGSMHADLQQALSRLARAGVAVVRSSRTLEVRVTRGAALDDAALGFVASGTLNPYKARLLLLLALSDAVIEPAALQAVFDAY
ncbi:MAG: asparaginase [Janthinobacterium lividum]